MTAGSSRKRLRSIHAAIGDVWPQGQTSMRGGKADFRPDLEGLRGIAVLLVVAYHAGMPVGGGFIGVDVFFVLSGFLITGLLIRERERTGRIDVAAFYGRRVRRILPAAMAAVVGTVLLVPLVISPLDLPRVVGDGVSSILAFANLRFAATDLDYFAITVTPSPFRQFWSLAVEEQFYLLWPALLIVATRFWTPRRGAGLVVAGVLAGSFLACLAITGIAVPWAFYSLPTRAWQLAAGGLLAIGVPALGLFPRVVLAATGWVGVGLLAVAALLFGDVRDYPGIAALVPTVAAVAIIAAGGTARSPGALLCIAPLRFFGRISYSLYLWHWPILVLAAATLGGPPSPVLMGVLVTVAIVLATVSYAFIEQPFRHPNVGRSVGYVLRRGAFAIAAVVVFTVSLGAGAMIAAGVSPLPGEAASVSAGGGTIWDTAGLDDPTIHGGENLSGPSATDLVPAITSPGTTTRGSMSGAGQSPSPTFVASISAPATGDAVSGVLPTDVHPSVWVARDDVEPLAGDGCGLDHGGVTPEVCIFGRRDAPHTVVLIGDSHAAQWFGALRVLAEQRDWRLIPFTKSACTFTAERIIDTYTMREYTECAAWRTAVAHIVPLLHPDLVVVAFNRWIIPADGEPSTITDEGKAIGRLLAALPHPVVLISDTPYFGIDVPACLASHRANIDACRAPLDATGGYYVPREKVAASTGHATWVDMTRAICPAIPCSPVVNDTIVMRDDHHLTYSFSRLLAAPLGAVLDRIGVGLEPGPGPAPASPAPSPGPPDASQAPLYLRAR